MADKEDDTTETVEPQVIDPEKVRGKRGRPKGVKRAGSKLGKKEIIEILELRAKGVDQVIIAKNFGVSQATVSNTVAQFSGVFKELKNVDNFRAVRSNIYDAAQLAALKSLVRDDKLEKAGVRDLAIATDILGKHSRLERGLSTANTQNLNLNGTFTLDGFLK